MVPRSQLNPIALFLRSLLAQIVAQLQIRIDLEDSMTEIKAAKINLELSLSLEQTNQAEEIMTETEAIKEERYLTAHLKTRLRSVSPQGRVL